MKSIFENVIKRGSYDLEGIIAKIDTYHIEGKISDTERDELYTLARVRPEARLDTEAEIFALWKAVKALEAKVNGGGDTPDETIPEFVQPTGAHDAYMTGDKVIYGGVVYRSTTDNNVWNPDVLPSAWEKVE